MAFPNPNVRQFAHLPRDGVRLASARVVQPEGNDGSMIPNPEIAARVILREITTNWRLQNYIAGALAQPRQLSPLASRSPGSCASCRGASLYGGPSLLLG